MSLQDRKDQCVTNAVMALGFRWAAYEVFREMPLWQEGEWTVLLPSCLMLLLTQTDADEWLGKHPEVLISPEQPLHAASFRIEDLRKYNRILTMVFDHQTLHLAPEHGDELARLYLTQHR